MGGEPSSPNPAEQKEKDTGDHKSQKTQDGDNGDRPMGKGRDLVTVLDGACGP